MLRVTDNEPIVADELRRTERPCMEAEAQRDVSVIPDRIGPTKKVRLKPSFLSPSELQSDLPQQRVLPTMILTRGGVVLA